MTLERQPLPDESHCPACGAKATDESILQHRLSNLGYSHDDIHMECSECSETWTHGVPIGTGGYDDLDCDSCGEEYLVHRVELNLMRLINSVLSAAAAGAETRGSIDREALMSDHKIRLHVKCEACNLFDVLERDVDDRGVSLVGYPSITGDQTDSDPYGW